MPPKFCTLYFMKWAGVVLVFSGIIIALWVRLSQLEQKTTDLEHELSARPTPTAISLPPPSPPLDPLGARRALQQKLADLNAQLQQLNRLDASAERLKTLDWDLNQEKEKLDQLKKNLNQVKDNKKESQSQFDYNHALVRQQRESTVSEINLQLQEEGAQLKALQAQYKQLKSQRRDITAQQDARSLWPQIQAEKNKIQDLRAQLVNAKQSVTEVNVNSNLMLNEENRDFKVQVDQLNDSIKDEEARVKALQDQRKQVEDSKNNTNQTRKTLLSQIAEIRDQLSNLQPH